MSYHFSRTKRFVLFFLGLTIAGIVAVEYHIPFGTVKICFDSMIVISAIIFSLCCFQNITGVREGTVIGC